MAKAKILVTGAAGFIGSSIVAKLSAEGAKVVALDGLLGGLYPEQEKRVRFQAISSLPGVETFQLDLRTMTSVNFPRISPMSSTKRQCLAWV